MLNDPGARIGSLKCADKPMTALAYRGDPHGAGRLFGEHGLPERQGEPLAAMRLAYVGTKGPNAPQAPDAASRVSEHAYDGPVRSRGNYGSVGIALED